MSTTSDNVKTVRLEQGQSVNHPEEAEYSQCEEKHGMNDALPNYNVASIQR